MKTLKNHFLVFDDGCPLCRTYTHAFIHTGMLDANGREAYQQMNEATCALIDKERARNEIALVNRTTGEVEYGVSGILKVIGENYPVFKPLFRHRAFLFIMTKIYAFISYNRKVIMPGNPHDTCNPDLNRAYRWAYLFITWLVTSVILSRYSATLNGMISPGPWFREYVVCGGQIVFQAMVIRLMAKEKTLTYLGNMMTISMAGAFLLAGVLCAGNLFRLENPLFYAGAFLAVAGGMLFEHIRRVKLIEVTPAMSVSWVVYRLLILILILIDWL